MLFDSINKGPRNTRDHEDHVQRVMNLISRHNYRETPVVNVLNQSNPSDTYDHDYFESHKHNHHFAMVHPKILKDEKVPTSPTLRKLTMYDPSTQGLKHFDLSDDDVHAIRKSRVSNHVEGYTGVPATFTHIPEHIKNQVAPLTISSRAEKHHELYNNYKDFNKYNVMPKADREQQWATHSPTTWNGDDFKETHTYLKGFHNQYPESLSRLGTGDLSRIYSTTASNKINNALVSAYLQEPHVHPAALNDFVNEIKGGMARSPLKNHLTTYSGMAFDPTTQINKGIYHTPAFTSTSIDPKVTKKFIYPQEPKAEKHIAVFHLKPGYDKGAYIQPVSTHSDEYEYLLAPNQKFKHLGSVSNKKLPDYNNKSKTENVTYHHFEPVEE